ncbi:hypothetical protein BU23DRAFT_650031 [Bimuria novae-zelandiae CBS 107.79]|uniref:BTB domain-containing protein n=1 Tax=Bimuria novae-zelandiae CBS 107.79 TaxID=1447943 RepID=A0A6A5UZ32_9PLEO|nr:hypothetical protein BU23DRAFT_650031 [Bimuria novae-zelandiae CBS 107.79]
MIRVITKHDGEHGNDNVEIDHGDKHTIKHEHLTRHPNNENQHDEQSEYWIQRDLLRSSSSFFKAATKDKWDALRDSKHTVTITFDPVLSEAYIHWLHHCTICWLWDDDTVPDKDDYPYLAKLYVMGEDLMDTTFKNALLDTFSAVATSGYYYPTGEAVATIYSGTPANSAARRLLVDMCASRARDHPSWQDSFDNFPREALLDMLKETTQLREPSDDIPWQTEEEMKNTYHE